MSKVQLAGNVSGTGVFTIASPNSNVDRTLTLPDNTGTLLSSASTLSPSQLGSQFSINASAPAGSFTMDSAGRVRIPNQPSFRVGFSSGGDQSIVSGGIAPFDAKSFDVGNNYNTSTNRFVAPVAGLYLFYANLYLTASGGSFVGGIGFTVNGSQVSTPAGDAARSDANLGPSTGQMTIISVTNTVLVSLAANDFVQVFGVNYSGPPSSYRYYRGTSFFQGYLLG